MPASRISAMMRSTASSGRRGTSSQKSMARSLSRYGWSDASADPGTSRRIVAPTSARRRRFAARSASLAAKRLRSRPVSRSRIM